MRTLALLLTIALQAPANSDAPAPLLISAERATLREAAASVDALNHTLLAGQSATLTLDEWCRAHHLSTDKIVADRDHDVPQTADATVRQILGVAADAPVRHRRVSLRCGVHVLSVADNWYVPARLTPEMNRTLDTTDVAFGRAVLALNYQRRTLSARKLWQPLRLGRAIRGRRVVAVPGIVLEHRAVLSDGDGAISYVVEHYTSATLDFMAAQP